MRSASAGLLGPGLGGDFILIAVPLLKAQNELLSSLRLQFVARVHLPDF